MGLLDRLFPSRRPPSSPEQVEAVERAVYLVEPRLLQAGGYPDRYLRGVANALDYVRGLAAQVPGPLRINRETYARDPLVHAMFSSVDEVRSALCVSRAMSDFRRDYPDAGEVYALVCMRRKTHAMLGMEMDGEILRRDVPQEVVFFTDHTLADPGRTEAEARERIAWGFFDSLMAHVAKRIESRKQEKTDLTKRRDELLAQIRAGANGRREEYEAQLRDCLERLTALTESLDLRRYGEDFDAVLLAPEDYLSMQCVAMNLDSMGLLREQPGVDAAELEFCDLSGRDRRRWTVSLMYCNHVREEGTITDRLRIAERWLGL